MSDRIFTVCHCGDYGDIIHGCAVMKAISAAVGHPILVVCYDRNSICKRIVHRLGGIKPLLESQDYIREIKEYTDEPIHWNAGDFRANHELTRSLAWAHLMHYTGNRDLPSISPNLQAPWLTGITPDPRAKGRIVINRTSRYQNHLFRWTEIVRHYGDRLLFVGTPEELHAFSSVHGAVPHQPTADLLEVARLIAASDMFIGNQSACFAVAEGMKHRRLLEVCLHQPDVIVTKEHHGNIFYSADGSLDLPPMAGKPALQIPGALQKVNYLKNPNTQPRTGWKIAPPFSKQEYREVSHSTLLRRFSRAENLSEDAAHRLIFDALAAREPDYFAGNQQQAVLLMFQSAVANAL